MVYSMFRSVQSTLYLSIIVITVMVSGAWSVVGDTGLRSAWRFMVLFGAISFYFSDLFVARDRFIKQELWSSILISAFRKRHKYGKMMEL